jgi:hypothetical protein
MIPNISSNCNNAVFDVFAIYTSESLTLTDNWVSICKIKIYILFECLCLNEYDYRGLIDLYTYQVILNDFCYVGVVDAYIQVKV